MAKSFIKKGDTVLVITGKDSGKTGKVMEVMPKENKAVVENINIVTKHQKPKSAQDKGGIIKKPAAMEASNLMVVCPVCGKATRVSRKTVEGANVRICKKCGASLDKKYVKTVKKEAKKEVKQEIVKDEVKQEVKKDKNVTKKPATNTKVSNQSKTRDNVKTTVRKTVAGGK